MAAQHCEYIQNHLIVYFKWVNFIIYAKYVLITLLKSKGKNKQEHFG